MRTMWLQASLAISIAFNLGLVIFLLNRPPAWHPHTPEDFLARVQGRMPATDFAKLKQVMDLSKPEITEQRARSEHAMQQVVLALKAEPFNEENLKSAMEAARIAHGDSEQAFQNAILAAAPGLTRNGRLTLAPDPHPEPGRDRH